MLHIVRLTLIGLLSISLPTAGRKVIVKNSCKGTIWPAYASTRNRDPLAVITGEQPGWKLDEGGTSELTISDAWNGGRIWARTGGCFGDVAKCQIGRCGDHEKDLVCDVTKYGVPGATQAEFTFDASGDSYDVSMVEGFSVPIKITPSDQNCKTGSCGTETDILTRCDPRLVWPKGSKEIFGCAMPCTAGIEFKSFNTAAFNELTSPTCCRAEADGDTCPESNIPFYEIYKPMCKDGYVYSKDDPNNAVHKCDTKPTYTVEFCPDGLGSGVLDHPPAVPVPQSPGPGGDIKQCGTFGLDGGKCHDAPSSGGPSGTESPPPADDAAPSVVSPPPPPAADPAAAGAAAEGGGIVAPVDTTTSLVPADVVITKTATATATTVTTVHAKAPRSIGSKHRAKRWAGHGTAH